MAGVQEQIYRGSGQVSAAAALPEASPNVFGAGIGEAIAQVGGELEASSTRAMQADRQRQEQSELSEKGAQYAEIVGNYKAGIRQLEDTAEPDGTGHPDNVRNLGQQTFNDFLGSIKSRRVREHFSPLVAAVVSDQVDGADVYARGLRLKSIGEGQRQANEGWASQLLLHPEPDGLKAAIDERTKTIAALEAPPDVKQKLLDQSLDGIEYNYGQGLTRANPGGAKAVFESGVLTHLSPEHRLALLNANDTDIRIADADARRVQSQQVAQLHEDVTEYKQRIDRGELPGDDESKALASRAKALGQDNLVDDIGYSSGKLKMSRLTDKWTPAEWEAHVNPLAAKVAQGKATADEQVQLRVLQDLRPAKEARFHSDPDGFAAAGGVAPPQVDLANPDPGTIQARKSWARSFARTGGMIEPPYLSKDQLQAYRDRANQSPVGKLEVAAELRNTWGMDAAPSIVRQIGGEAKPDMLIMLGLNDRMGQVYSRGVEALSKKTIKFNDDTARQLFSTYATAVPPDLRPALFDAARNIAAGWMSEQGKTEPTADFADVFSKAVHRAGGMLGSWGEGSATGGFANWNGRFAWLPPDMARSDFGTRISRAAPHDWISAAVDAAGNPTNAVPHHLGPDGKLKPYTKGEASRFGQGRLQTVAPGIYQLTDAAGGTVVDASGRPWQFDVRRLPRSHTVGSR